MAESSLTLGPPAATNRRAVVLTGLTVLVAVLGLLWAKWWPYADRTSALAADGVWPGTSILTTGAGDNPWLRAWDFTWTYSLAVWKALLVALVVAACVDVLLPRRWLLRALGRRTPLGGSLAGGLASLPGMMCTCCAAPLVVTLRRSGVPRSAALAFWLGNPVLNPAVLIFLALLAPWSWLAVRVVLGLALVIGVAALLGWWADRRRTGDRVGPVAVADRAVAHLALEPAEDEPAARIAGRWLRSLGRMALVVVPEYLVVVYLVGLVGAPLGERFGAGGVLAVVLAAVVGTLLVLPTAGEVPILLGLAAAGASPAVLGALLITLPALSVPSMVIVGRAMGVRVTLAAAAAVAAVGVVAGGALAGLG